MKKSTVALGVIVALGAASVGGAWFTGQKAETEYMRQLTQSNEQLKMLGLAGINVEYKNKQFDRGLFSSQVEDEIVISVQKEQKAWTIPLSTTLYHGPLPLNQLAKFNFTPAMFSVEGLIGKNETTQPLFDVSKSDKPVQYHATTSYGLSTKGELEIAAGELTDSNSTENKFSWSNLIFGFDVNKELSGVYRFSTDNILLNLDGNMAPEDSLNDNALTSMKWKITGLKMEGTQAPTKWAYLYTGNISSVAENMEFTSTDNTGKVVKLIEKGAKSTTDISLDGDFINIKGKSVIDSLIFDDKELGTLTNNTEFNHIEANAVNALFEALVNIIKLSKDDNNDGAAGEILTIWYQNHGMAVFNNQPQIKFNPISVSDKQGKLALDLNVALAKNPKFDFIGDGGLFKQFTDFAVNIHVDKATAERVLSLFVPEDEKSMIKARIEEQAQQAAAQNIVVNSDKTVTLNLVLKDNELKLNGQVIPEEEVKGMLFLLMLSGALQGN